MTTIKNSTFLNTQNKYQYSQNTVTTANQKLDDALKKLYTFECGSEWRGIPKGGTPNEAMHASLVASFQAAQKELQATESALNLSKTDYNEQKSAHPELGNKCDRIA